jgi:FtsP/CotA-like multicopper oxidase with cupredoxin domain
MRVTRRQILASGVDLVNRVGTSTIIHWHGQLPPLDFLPLIKTQSAGL